MLQSDIKLPDAGAICRRLAFQPCQKAGFVVILAIPLLAVFGVFDKREAEISDTGHGLNLSVKYPVRERQKNEAIVRIEAMNQSSVPLPVTLEVSRDYLESMSDLQVEPMTAQAEDTVYSLDLGTLAPGKSTTAELHFTLERHGWPHGRISAVSQGNQLASVGLSTLVLP